MTREMTRLATLAVLGTLVAGCGGGGGAPAPAPAPSPKPAPAPAPTVAQRAASDEQEGVASMKCGRRIRAAWLSARYP